MTCRVWLPESGICIQYNGATWASRAQHYTDLYTKQGGSWIAQVPNSCLIEWVHPCSVTVTRDFEAQREINQRFDDKLADFRRRQRRQKRARAKKRP